MADEVASAFEQILTDRLAQVVRVAAAQRGENVLVLMRSRVLGPTVRIEVVQKRPDLDP